MENYTAWKQEVSSAIVSKAKFYKDFPKPGVNFMDLFSLTSDPEFFKQINEWTIKIIEQEIGVAGIAFDVIVGLESRGFI